MLIDQQFHDGHSFIHSFIHASVSAYILSFIQEMFEAVLCWGHQCMHWREKQWSLSLVCNVVGDIDAKGSNTLVTVTILNVLHLLTLVIYLFDSKYVIM